MDNYLSFFNLNEDPFKITPDVEYFFMSPIHHEALMSLNYLLSSGEGFAVIIGEPGTGKTITIRKFINELPKNVEYAYILFPNLSPEEMFKAILEDFGISYNERSSKNKLFSKLKDFLVEKRKEGKKVLIIIDEAQNLPIETLEELRILSNLETEKDKLIQFILLGQPELEHKLESPQLRQLKQRITLMVKFRNLNQEEITNYIVYRLAKAGNTRLSIDPDVYKYLYSLTDGNLRKVNILMERALMSAFVENSFTITKRHIQKAENSINNTEEEPITDKNKILIPAAASVIFVIISVAVYFLYPNISKKSEKIVPTNIQKNENTNIQKQPVKALIAYPMVEIKNKPSPKGKKIAVLKKGSVLKVLDTAKNWAKVSFETKNGKRTGWVYKEFIVFVSEKGTPSSKKEFISSRSSI
jgi:general secretion pathway protein A